MKYVFLTFASIAVFGLAVSAQTFGKADFAKKIADATPPELPQTPVPVRKGSDARDRRLRWNVKSVIEYRVDADDRLRLHKLSTQSFFNEAGNLTKAVSADDEGYPQSVSVFGYIDGMMVSRSGGVIYVDGEKPRPPAGRANAGLLTAINSNAPRDTRYHSRFEYSYDAHGRLIEERQYRNNGELWVRSTYTYSGEDPTKERLRLDYGSDGKEQLRTRDILYPSGDIKERDMYDEGKISDREIHQYSYDARGNWIVDRVFEPKPGRGRQVLKPLWTMYRTITYYLDGEWQWWRDHVKGQESLKRLLKQQLKKKHKR
ncbi:MAG: hypothetical protein ABI878_11520 [Acidobacteriota bacterium]